MFDNILVKKAVLFPTPLTIAVMWWCTQHTSEYHIYSDGAGKSLVVYAPKDEVVFPYAKQ